MAFSRHAVAVPPVPLIAELKKTVDAGLHLDDSLFPESRMDGCPPPERVKPLFTVSFEEFDLNGIDTAYKQAKDEFRILRNFILGKKKGLCKEKSALSFYCVINWKQEVIYYLTVESTLIEKISLVLLLPQLSVKMRITGLDREYVVHLKEIFSFRAVKKLESASDTNEITKQALENAARSGQGVDRMISFHLTVDLECTGAFNLKKAPGPGVHPGAALYNIYLLPDSTKDVTFVASNKKEIKAHKSILMGSGQSKVFLSMFDAETETPEAKSGRILLEQYSAEGINLFVRSLYGFDVPIEKVSRDLALEVFQLSHKFMVTEMEVGMKNSFLCYDVEWYTVDSLLKLYFYAKNIPVFEDVAEHALIEMSKVSKQSMMSSDYFKNLGLEGQRDLLLELWDRK